MMDTCVSASADTDLSSLSPCSHEEADTRMMLHIDAAATSGHRNILATVCDCDVVNLAVRNYVKWEHKIDELWIEFGLRKKRRYDKHV